MADAPTDSCDTDREALSSEWAAAAVNASHNLDFEHRPSALRSEHWQMVLTSVAARMQMRGIMPSFGWKDALAR